MPSLPRLLLFLSPFLGVLSVHVAAACASADVVRSVRSGSWSDKSTWEGSQVPGAGDKVQIRAGHAVSYDLSSDAVIRSVHVAGVLTFATDRDTRLDVGLIRIHAGEDIVEEGFEFGPHVAKTASREVASVPGKVQCTCCDGKASLLVGTAEQPVEAKHTALIRLHYIAGMNEESCPAIVCCGGRMDFHGTPLSRTWVKLGATASFGATEAKLAEKVSGWKVGDRVILTGSSGNFGGQAPQTEERVLSRVEADRVEFDQPLGYAHHGDGEFRAEIANLSRNVIVESADPAGIRGHTMYHKDSAGSIQYAEFRHLGKKGLLGRYAIHYHLCRESMRGSAVIGAAIWDSHNRWLTIHGTEHLVVRDCVGYRSLGHGFFLEDGTETRNVLDRNLAVRAENGAPLPGQLLPFDKNDGAGYWWANSFNSFTRNVAADCAGYGFRYEATPRAGFKDGEKSFGSPRDSFNLALPVLQADGSRKAVDIRTLPFIRFDGNAAHNIANYGLNIGQDAGAGPDKDHPFVVRDMTIWNAQRGYTVHVPNVLIDGMHIHRCGYEVYRARYQAQDYRNVRLSGIRGSLTVSNLKEYLATGASAGMPGVGLTRSRLPGFPQGTGAGGNSFSDSAYEAIQLNPVDDVPPSTAITHIRVEGKTLVVRGATIDNGAVEKVLVNGLHATPLAQNFAEWEAVLDALPTGPRTVSAHAVDAKGNVEVVKHQVPIAVR